MCIWISAILKIDTILDPVMIDRVKNIHFIQWILFFFGCRKLRRDLCALDVFIWFSISSFNSIQLCNEEYMNFQIQISKSVNIFRSMFRANMQLNAWKMKYRKFQRYSTLFQWNCTTLDSIDPYMAKWILAHIWKVAHRRLWCSSSENETVSWLKCAQINRFIVYSKTNLFELFSFVVFCFFDFQ